MKVKKLTKPELKELTKILELFEQQTYEECCTGKISGEFASAEIFDYDNDFIDIELKFGTQSDCEDRVNTEQWKLNRNILTKKMSIVAKVNEIED